MTRQHPSQEDRDESAPGLQAGKHSPKGGDVLPRGLTHAFWFATFNAFSFQIVLGSPMILYARSLEAGAAVLGLIAGMMPLLVIFQIPAAPYVERVGYRKFVYGGWSIRVMIIGLMSLLPLLSPWLNPSSTLGLLLAALFGFNLSRGISSCGWLPWITALVPASIRGRYLAVDTAFVNSASFAVCLLSAFALGSNPPPWRFAALFAFSAAMGAISLSFLKRIPDVAPPREDRGSGQPVPWGAIAGFSPFRRLLWFAVAWSFVFGGVMVFGVAWMKHSGVFSEQTILLLSSFSFVGGFGSLLLLGERLDRLGSRPVLLFAQTLTGLMLCGWTAMAGGLIPASLGSVALLMAVAGLCGAVVQMANTRMVMAIAPAMGRSHFFALFSVVSNVSLGIAPVAWGLFIDVFGARRLSSLGLEWNSYSSFFAAAATTLLAAVFLCNRLEEPQTSSMQRLLKDVLIESPQRFVLRLWGRGSAP
ncbi:MAG: MFS transporter [Verrucomicrobia bacterium]|nr:MFS transporter [Verrucomicrobiota bacterium]